MLPGAYSVTVIHPPSVLLAGCVLHLLLPVVLSFFLLMLADGFFLVYVLTASSIFFFLSHLEHLLTWKLFDTVFVSAVVFSLRRVVSPTILLS